MSRELLHSFIQTYQHELKSTISSPDLFNEFTGKITQVVRSSVQPVLDRLSEARGIVLVILTNNEGSFYSTSDVDKITVLANHQALVGIATDMSKQHMLELSYCWRFVRCSALFLFSTGLCSLQLIYFNVCYIILLSCFFLFLYI